MREINNLIDIKNQRKSSLIMIIFFMLVLIISIGMYIITNDNSYIGVCIISSMVVVMSNIDLRYWDTKYHMIKMYKQFNKEV